MKMNKSDKALSFSSEGAFGFCRDAPANAVSGIQPENIFLNSA